MGILQYPSTITYAVYAAAYLAMLFGAGLKEVFIICFPRASHQPAAFCVLLQITTYSYHCQYMKLSCNYSDIPSESLLCPYYSEPQTECQVLKLMLLVIWYF